MHGRLRVVPGGVADAQADAPARQAEDLCPVAGRRPSGGYLPTGHTYTGTTTSSGTEMYGIVSILPFLAGRPADDRADMANRDDAGKRMARTARAEPDTRGPQFTLDVRDPRSPRDRRDVRRLRGLRDRRDVRGLRDLRDRRPAAPNG